MKDLLGEGANFAILAGFIVAGISAVLTFAFRYALLPALNRHVGNLVAPIKDTLTKQDADLALIRKQVSENSHANEKPTVLDKVDDVSVLLAEHIKVADQDRTRLANVEADVKSLKAAS